MDSATFLHSPLGREPNAMRILYLHPAYEYYAEIRCKLQHSNLDRIPSYKALSYVWGDQGETLPILVDGKRYHVTANCHAALLRLRQRGVSCLWIDAICINQSDDKEKSLQVGRMRDIYHAAEEVIVWLGKSEAQRGQDDEANEKLAFAFMKDLSGRSIEDIDQLIQRPRPDEILRWKAMLSIFNHNWFERLWAHQEYTVAPKARALTMYHSESFQKIEDVAWRISQAMERNSSLPRRHWRGFSRSFNKIIFIVKARLAHRSIYDRETRQIQDVKLIDLMTFTSLSKCLDPRDHVFAVIGLLGHDRKGEVQVDYTAPLSQVYASVSWFMINDCQSLRPLCFDRPEALGPVDGAELPSWVFDWRTEVQGLSSSIYHASLNTQPSVSFSSASLTLEVKGFCVDRVLKYSSTLVFPQELHSVLEWASTAPGLILWKECFDRYPNGCEPKDAWIRTITADMTQKNGKLCRINEDVFLQFKLASKENERSTAEYKHMFRMDQDGKQLEDSVRDISLPFVYGITKIVKGRKFFISESGYMGVGPLALREGDRICILLGCNVPMLIRQEGDYYRLVGECFLWGLMDGEGLQERKEIDQFEVFRLK